MTYLTLAHGAVGGSISKASGGEFSKGFKLSAGMKLLSMVSQNMRAEMIEQSRQNSANSSGISIGFNGDGFKLGGGRFVEGLENQFPSPLGGFQGDAGQMFGGSESLFGWDYDAGSFTDYAVEAYAGPHDYLNSGYWYNAAGNAINRNGIAKYFGEALNAANVVFATPFVAASVIPPHVVTGLRAR
jgi:filamentous hemagglutinin